MLFNSEIRSRAKKVFDDFITKVEADHDLAMDELEKRQEEERESLTENAVAKITNLFITK